MLDASRQPAYAYGYKLKKVKNDSWLVDGSVNEYYNRYHLRGEADQRTVPGCYCLIARSYCTVYGFNPSSQQSF